MHQISMHNSRSGGTTRERLLEFTDASISAMCSDDYTDLYEFYLQLDVRFRYLIFEKLFWIYKPIYGFDEYEISDDNSKN